MRKIWTARYSNRWPWVGSDGDYDDDLRRTRSWHTIVIPFPIATETTRDHTKYFSSVVIGIPNRLAWCKCLENT